MKEFEPRASQIVGCKRVRLDAVQKAERFRRA